MGSRKRKIIRRKIADKKARLEMLKERERRILEGEPQSYGIGSRNLSRYSLDFGRLEELIAQLEDEIDELEAELDGCKARKAVAAVARDW